MYTRTVMEHFANPRNVGTIENADAHARVRSTVHDDLIDLYLRIEDDRIVEVRYLVHGCAAAIASSSMASELVQGMTLDEAASITAEQISEALGGLPESKIDCSVLAPTALRQAIEAYRAGRA
ncbi:MAG TPA: iron-sulfur cluster assembly scaffold protein [Chloroflexi bacterium]|jgi:nitrogen fixation NifU-like protein|nr:iron-sulfur cluster assembly scaffold protein [Chloroflexota bacterium]